jgi:trk system potassium uptake protein
MPLSYINRIREKINLRLYRHKNIVVKALPVLSSIVSLFALGSIIYYFGFPKTPRTYEVTLTILQLSYAFYVLKFALNVFYDFNPIKFIRDNWFEASLILVILITFFANRILNIHLFISFVSAIGRPELEFLSFTILQVYFFAIFFVELGKGSPFITKLNIGPAGWLAVSFVMLIMGGALLLKLPEMTTGHHIRFIDALFTSCSASCVTGLIVQDTATFFTFKGKIIIMLLIQMGGISIISFATFFATFYRKSAGIKYQSMLKDFLSTDKMSDTRIMLRKIILFSILIELIGTVLLTIFWFDYVQFKDLKDRLFYSVFHSVSAFNNAGFALFSANMYEYSIRYAYLVQLTIAALIFLGGIGFMAMEDMFTWRNIRERYKYKWKHMQLNTRVALRTSVLLIVVGSLLFYLLESRRSMPEHSIFGKLVVSVFHSISARTAGFNSVDFTIIGQPMLVIFIILMFIGASPGSTGGGIKTTTFSIILRSALATIRGKKNVEMYKHSISFDLIDKAYSIVLFATALIFCSSIVLCLTDPHIPFLNLLFEEVSAFGTVGLSTGITPYLSDGGKFTLVFSMFTGRIGPLTLALVLSRRVAFTKYKYSSANILVG